MSNVPETSKEANILKTQESRNKDYKRIVEAYKVIGQGHYEDVAKFLGLKDLNIVSRRMKEMRDLKLLVNTGIKKMTSRQRSAFVHTLSNETQSKTETPIAYKQNEPTAVSFANNILKQAELFGQ